MVRKAAIELWREFRYLIVTLLLMSAGCAALWQFGRGQLADLGLNAFTEISGILVTVLLVDHLLKRQAARRILPQRVAAYEDTCFLTDKIIGVWADAFSDCGTAHHPKTVDELFRKECFEEIYSRLNLDAQPRVMPPRKWDSWLYQRLQEIHELGERILERHNSILDPYAYGLVHRLATDGSPNRELLPLRNYDARAGIPRIPTPKWFAMEPPEDFYANVLSLVVWCQAEELRLRDAGMSPRRSIRRAVFIWCEQTPPYARLSDEALAAHTQRYIEHISSRGNQ